MKRYALLFFQYFVFCLLSYGQVQNPPLITPRARVIIDNDFSGDPDGLFQLAHLALSPSVEIRGVIGSHLRPKDWFDSSDIQAVHAAAKANALLSTLHLKTRIPVFTGSNTAMPNDSTPVQSEAVDLIIRETLRTDTKEPLYILCGAGLTEVASAVLKAPEIAGKFTLIWIGGPEYPDLAPAPPRASGIEYNLNIDIAAAKLIFNRSAVNVWQVPRSTYRQPLIAYSELIEKIKPYGETGHLLVTALEDLMLRVKKSEGNLGETYILGDSPLVLLSALQSPYEPDPSSSAYVTKKAPRIDSEGAYEDNPDGRKIRVYVYLDTRLLFEDFFAKMKMLTRGR
ncbi:nucleoside hydrolase [Mucilaginibacter sp. BJC16-A38]|uniref:nucleoside hydrolase n=1 Tax=Mucilaginibacter phenanthrenivorans TaxID=1234842 RepID=UPI0021587D2D|nr:nucleoside hydrolase [Mucilaginibacter phenanthrenivorans]MCR8556396.1 nucleoside hydrolase [Mucilaginibacter phenanthrenivorans]